MSSPSSFFTISTPYVRQLVIITKILFKCYYQRKPIRALEINQWANTAADI